VAFIGGGYDGCTALPILGGALLGEPTEKQWNNPLTLVVLWQGAKVLRPGDPPGLCQLWAFTVT